jgi:hypothetical protein
MPDAVAQLRQSTVLGGGDIRGHRLSIS